MKKHLIILVYYFFAFFMFYAEAAEPVIISSTVASGEYSHFYAKNVINGNGLDEYSPSGLHDNRPQNMWFTKFNPDEYDTWIIFDLGDMFFIDSMYVWNFNSRDSLDYGIREVKIEYSETGGAWTILKEIYQLERGVDRLTSPTDIIEISAYAQYVRLTVLNTWGGKYAGLSEVMFTKPGTADETNNIDSPSVDTDNTDNPIENNDTPEPEPESEPESEYNIEKYSVWRLIIPGLILLVAHIITRMAVKRDEYTL